MWKITRPEMLAEIHPAAHGTGYVRAVASTMTDLRDIELGEIEAMVGPQSFERGRAYARKGRVLKLEWDPHAEALTGSVVGQVALYATTAFFASAGGGALAFEDGECSCPVGYNCKHVAAIVVAATDLGLPRPGPAQRPLHPVSSPSPLPSWEAPLRALIEPPEAPASGTPIAIELAMHRGGGAAERGGRRLLARLMRPGARGGWVNGTLAWGGLDAWQVRSGGFRPDHLALVSELHAIDRASHRRTFSYSYGSYGAEKALDLSDYGPQLWPLLDEAARIGLPLVHARSGLGELARHVNGEVQIDVTRPPGTDAVVRARLCVDGDGAAGLEPLLFLGPSGHGVVCAEAAAGDPESRPLRLVRLTRPVARQLQRMLLDGGSLVIPAGDLRRFSEELCPALLRIATVVSSDGSFTPPELSPPSLVLRARYSAPHTVELGWEWAYQVGGTTSRVPLTAGGRGIGFRDIDAERTILAGTALAEAGLDRFGLVDDRGRPHDGPAPGLQGLDSMRFTTEHLPRLSGLPGIAVEIEGEPADYRDVAASLEIGVSTGEIEGDRDWFDLGVTITVEGRLLPFADVFVALASSESEMLLPDGAHFSLHDARLQSLRELIEEARALVDSPSAPLRLSRYQAGLWAELVALGVVTHQARAWQSQVEALLELDAITDHALPSTLLAELRPYQRDGFAWLATLWELGLGGILADDMGLGKTLQALALICHARDRDPDVGPFLVVAPTSVVPGWVGEAAQFAPTLRVEAVTDTFAKSGRTIDEVAKADVVVTTYTLLRIEPDTYGSVAWAGVICDEAQNVKNHQAKSYRCVRQLAAPFKLALTGTPMENNLMELWSLLSITAPGLFPEPKRFAEQYARPIERHGDRDRLARLRRRIKPLVKRRTKELVAADLPAKQEQTLEVDLHPRHRKLYDTHLQRERQRVLGLLGDFDRNRFTILRSITLLRQLSLHAELVDARHHGVPCAKLGALTEQLVDVIGGGHRALVFSQFTSFLAKVRERLDREGVSYCYLDGRTRSRQRVIERFRGGDDPAFLISLKAGGVGLNLTEADYCFLLDPWWNPAIENQAIDRTHRIGQTRPVMVYRMIARDTIEEKVVALARRKA
ncbi:MAG: SNF2-related protein, partial [Acidimicrobiales bacterium]